MPDGGYAAARAVAPKLRAHFTRDLPASRDSDSPPDGVSPSVEDIESLVDAAFWASLRREEGYEPRISLALLAPEEAAQPMRFSHSLSLRPTTLTRVAPAVERPGIHLGVWRQDGDLRVWGTTR